MSRELVGFWNLSVGWLFIIVLWSVLSYGLGIEQYLLASPGRVLRYVEANGGQLVTAFALTGAQATVGWLLAVISGAVTGAVAFYVPGSKTLLLPMVVALQTTPIIAIAPLIALWFGYGIMAKILVACIVALFPILTATYTGMNNVRPNHLFLYRLGRAGGWRIFWELRVPSAWLALLPALKTAAVFAIIGSIVADFMGGADGLGFLIMKATYASRSDQLIAAVVLSAILGHATLLILERATRRFEKRFEQ